MDLLNRTLNSSHLCPSIDDFRNQVYSTAYSMITVFGLFGNGMALYFLWTSKQQTPFHTYMLNLALSDLLCVCTLPLRVIYYVSRSHWSFGDLLCRVSSYALYVNLYCSIYFMVAMSLTRFLAIVFPVRNLRIANKCKARIVCISIWVFICAASTPFLMTGTHVDPQTNKTKCFEPPATNHNLKKLVMLNYISISVCFLLPFLVILICYAGIIRALLSTSNSLKKQKGTRTRAIRMIVIVMVTFLVSFTPYHIQRTIHLQIRSRHQNCQEEVNMQKSVVVTLCLAAANSCFDPMLYFFSGENFRRRFSIKQRTSISGTTLRRHRLAAEERDQMKGVGGGAGN